MPKYEKIMLKKIPITQPCLWRDIFCFTLFSQKYVKI